MNAVAEHRDPSAEVLQQVRERADVVLVPVREHDRLDVVGSVAHVLHVGQDEVDPGHVGRRERQPDVHDQQPAVELEAGHVPADLADPSEEDEAAAVRQGDRRPPAPCGRGPVRRSSRGPAADRGSPQPRPTIWSAAFTGIGFDVTNRALYSGESVSWILRAAGMSPVSIRSIIWRICGPTR